MHIYDGPDGKQYPSVTTIIHEIMIHPEPLLAWSNSLGFKRKTYRGALDESSAKGTAVHDFMYSYMKDIKEVKTQVPMKFAREIFYIVDEAKKFFIQHKMGPNTTTDAELTLIDTELGYAGTLDWVGVKDGVLTLVDYKTSKKARETMYIQLAAYDKLLQTQKGIKVDEACILLLHDDGVKEFILCREAIDHYYEVFELLLQIFYKMECMELLLYNEK